MDASLNFYKTMPLMLEALQSIDESLNLPLQNSGQGFEIQDKMSLEMKPLKKVSKILTFHLQDLSHHPYNDEDKDHYYFL